MPLAPSSDNLLLGKGSVFFDRFTTAGVAQGFRHLGNVTSFEIATQDDVIEKFESMSGASNLYRSVTRRRDVSLRCMLDEFAGDNLAIALMGDKGSYTQAATPITGETLTTSSLKGKYYKTAKLGIGTITVKQTAPAITLTLGTDYALTDAASGIIQILPGAGTTDASTITIDYTPTAYTAPNGLDQIVGGQSSFIRGKILFKPDPATGPKLFVEVWRATITPDSSLGLIGDDWGSMGLRMLIEDDTANHPTSPLFQVTYLP